MASLAPVSQLMQLGSLQQSAPQAREATLPRFTTYLTCICLEGGKLYFVSVRIEKTLPAHGKMGIKKKQKPNKPPHLLDLGWILTAMEQGKTPEYLQYIDDISVWSNTAEEVFEKGRRIIQILLKMVFAIKQKSNDLHRSSIF